MQDDDVWTYVCAGVPMLGVLFALNVVLLVMLLLTLPFLEPGTSSYYVSLLSFAVIGASFVGIVAVVRTCRGR